MRLLFILTLLIALFLVLYARKGGNVVEPPVESEPDSAVILQDTETVFDTAQE